MGLDAGVLAAGLAFGGGIAGCQAVCGALTGGVVAIGVAATNNHRERAEASRRARELAQGLYRDFQTDFGFTDCRTLTGHDFSAPGGYDTFRQDQEARERCRAYVAFAAARLAQEGDKLTQGAEQG